MSTEYVRVGADPEVFVKSVETRSIVPICGLVGGTKEAPILFQNFLKRNQEEGDYAYQEDGVVFEFNMPGTTGADRFLSNLRAVWAASQELLETKGLRTQIKAEHTFKAADLTHPNALRVGCSPDMYAYGEDGPEHRKPLNAQEFGFRRFAGGHLHLGYNKKVPPFVMVKFLDVLLGLPSLVYDKQGTRRQYYGLPGLYREKPYGLEYRSLSNYWLKGVSKGDYTCMIAGTMLDLGITAQTRPEILANAYKMLPWDDIRDAIKQENVDLGREIHRYAMNVARLPSRYSAELWRMPLSKEGT